MKIGQVIAQNRKNKGLSQIHVAKKLEDFDIHVGNAAISSWEKGINMPTANQLLALCQILEINDIYTEFIGENPKDPFRKLNAEGIIKAYDYIDLLESSGKYDKRSSEITPLKGRIMKIALSSASAGTGNFLDDENFDEIEIFEHVPKKAAFGVHLDGDSMEPVFRDGQLVWIEQTEYLESGDLGLFFLDGLTYFKKFVKKETGTFLVSLNANYKPIEVGEFSSFKIFGRLATD
ncbi:MAG: XRE family transcriptional regulator [Lachnospiraceae bacterium]|nr:XRE family transcriptional regulator [Lachnospiraceae bacterium]